MTERPEIFTVGELRASGHVQKDLRREIRDNLLAALSAGRDPWPGIFGFGRTVLPQLERDVLASLKEPTHESKQIVERLRSKGYTLAAGKEPDKVQFIEHEKTGVRIDIHQTKFGGQSIHEGIKAAIERTRQEELKREQKQTQDRSRGMRM